MKAFLEGTIVSVEPLPFKNEKGEPVPYSQIYVRDEAGAIQKFGTMLPDVQEHLDTEVVLELNLRPAVDNPKRFSVSISKVSKAE